MPHLVLHTGRQVYLRHQPGSDPPGLPTDEWCGNGWYEQGDEGDSNQKRPPVERSYHKQWKHLDSSACSRGSGFEAYSVEGRADHGVNQGRQEYNQHTAREHNPN